MCSGNSGRRAAYLEVMQQQPVPRHCWRSMRAQQPRVDASRCCPARIFRDYGEDKGWKRMARRVAEARQRTSIESTHALLDALKLPVVWHGHGKDGRRQIHPATRFFQVCRVGGCSGTCAPCIVSLAIASLPSRPCTDRTWSRWLFHPWQQMHGLCAHVRRWRG